MDTEKLRLEVENRMHNGESFSMKEIRKIMKKSGKSYAQVMMSFKKLKKDMEQEAIRCEEAGENFDRDAYISMRMKRNNGK